MDAGSSREVDGDPAPLLHLFMEVLARIQKP